MRAREFIIEDNESRTEEFQGVHMKLRDDGYEVVASALNDWGNEMGAVVFNKGDDNELDPQDLLVIDKYRGQGVAKVMYDYVKSKGYDIHKSYDVTKISDQGKESGEYFWKKNRGNKRVWEAELSESRGSLFNWIKQQFPTWPDYVLKDFLYQQAKGMRDQAEVEDFLKRNKQDFGQVQWKLEKLPITFDIFTPRTQRMLVSREGGSANPYKVPKDAERHAQQLKMIQQNGVSREPIIVAKLSNGYDLIEGWHRTIQHLKAFPQGYTGPAWVCTGATYKSESVEQGVENLRDIGRIAAVITST